jgi:hypothetical protein
MQVRDPKGGALFAIKKSKHELRNDRERCVFVVVELQLVVLLELCRVLPAETS